MGMSLDDARKATMAPSVIQHPMHAMVAPIGPPPPPVQMAMDGTQPDMPSDQPSVGRMTPVEQYENDLGNRLMTDYGKDQNPYGSATNHPGKLGKFLHGLSVATGGPNRRFAEEQQFGNTLENIEKEKSGENLQNAQAGAIPSEESLRGAETREANDRANALEHPAPESEKPYTISTDKGMLQWGGQHWTPIQVNGEVVNAPERANEKSLQRVAGSDASGKQLFANYHPDTGVFTDQQGNVIPNFKPADKAMQGAYGGFGPAFLAYRMLNSAYNENPALLPYIAPLITRMLSQGGSAPEGMQGALSNVPAGQPRNEQGEAIGLRMPGAPTGATRSRGQFAESVLPSISETENHIRNLGQQLGPMTGRWNELYTGKVGAFGPQFAELQTQLKNIGTAWMRLHANSETARQEFEQQLRGAQSPANLIAALNAIDQQARDYVREGQGRPDTLNEPPRPANVPEGYKFNANGPKGAGWYASTAK